MFASDLVPKMGLRGNPVIPLKKQEVRSCTRSCNPNSVLNGVLPLIRKPLSHKRDGKADQRVGEPENLPDRKMLSGLKA